MEATTVERRYLVRLADLNLTRPKSVRVETRYYREVKKRIGF